MVRGQNKSPIKTKLINSASMLIRPFFIHCTRSKKYVIRMYEVLLYMAKQLVKFVCEDRDMTTLYIHNWFSSAHDKGSFTYVCKGVNIWQILLTNKLRFYFLRTLKLYTYVHKLNYVLLL